MFLLTQDNDIFDINLATKYIKDDIYYGVLELYESEPKNKWEYDKKERKLIKVNETELEADYFFKKLFLFQKYEYPLVELNVGNYKVSLPLNWKILVCYPEHKEAELVPIEELVNFEHQAFMFNPFKDNMYSSVPVKVESICDNNITWFVPKLVNKNILILPLGNKTQWKSKTIGDKVIEKYPECIFVADDTEKFNEIFSLNILE